MSTPWSFSLFLCSHTRNPGLKLVLGRDCWSFRFKDDGWVIMVVPWWIAAACWVTLDQIGHFTLLYYPSWCFVPLCHPSLFIRPSPSLTSDLLPPPQTIKPSQTHSNRDRKRDKFEKGKKEKEKKGWRRLSVLRIKFSLGAKLVTFKISWTSLPLTQTTKC